MLRSAFAQLLLPPRMGMSFNQYCSYESILVQRGPFSEALELLLDLPRTVTFLRAQVKASCKHCTFQGVPSNRTYMFECFFQQGRGSSIRA